MAKQETVQIVQRRYTRRRTISVPLLTLQDHPHLYVQVLGAAAQRYVQGFVWSRDGTLPVVPVRELETNTTHLLVVPAQLQAAFMAVEGGYIGKCYELLVAEKLAGKRFGELEVYEIDPPVENKP